MSSPAASAAPVFPLKASANGRYLVDQNNVPFLIHGDTMWQWQRWKSFGSSTANIITYLDDRKAKGFTTLQMMSMFRNGGAVMTDIAGRKPFTQEITAGSNLWRFDTPNDAYFDHLKWIVTECAARGLQVNLCAFWLGANTDQGFSGDLNNSYNTEAKCYAFGQYLGTKFGNLANLMWIHGCDNVPTQAQARKLHKIMEGIRNTDAAPDALHTAHWRRPPSINLAREVYWSGVPEASFTDLDVEFIYSGSLTYWGCLRNWAGTWDGSRNLPTAPALMGESYYEEQARFSPPGAWPAYMCRRQAYWSLLSGAGHMYAIEFPAFPADLNSPGAQTMVHVQNVFRSRAWYELVPDSGHTVVTSGWGTKGTDSPEAHVNDTYVTTARALDGSLVMAYLPPTGTSGRTISVDMTKLSGQATAQWFNPATGAYTTISGSPFSNTGSRNFTTSGNNGSGQNDWLLSLNASVGSPPAQEPYGGVARSLPGTVQAEDFDEGGQNVAYYDTSTGNSGGASYRPGADVDIASTTDAGGGYNIGYAAAGEWLEYTCDVAAGGTYDLAFRVASINTGKSFRLEVDGVDVTGAMTVPNTGGHQVWQTIAKTGLSISSGRHIFRFYYLTDGFNFNYFSATAVGGPSTIDPEADTYVFGGSASTNFGTASLLYVKDNSDAAYDRISYLRFPVSGTVASATLHLTVTSLGAEGSGNRTIEVRQLADDTWSETGVIYSNRPSAAGALIATIVNAGTVGQTYSVDVTSYVNSQSDGNASFVLIQPSNVNKLVGFGSREDPGNKPVLEIE